jgi:Asp-tRNA(Asn)/Glu-tRNA(Gln) amidotransferase A subunit family amidase
MEAIGSYEQLSALAGDLRTGQLELLAYLDQLEDRFAQLEPKIHAFVEEDGRFDRLRRQAAELLELYPDPAKRPPLFGVPVGVKDIIRVEGIETRAGISMQSAALQGPEADCVSRLKRSGALILGKTVTTAFAYFSPGPTRNPHNPEHTPGGSSSGSAAAVSAGQCSLALGTQTIGSVIRPAAFCGVVGFKPSYGRISLAGVIPLATSVDHVGVLTTDVEGAALAASRLCYAWRERTTSRRPVLAVPEGPYLAEADPVGREHLAAVVAHLRDADLEVRYLPALSNYDVIAANHDVIVAAEAARAHSAWFDEFEAVYDPKLLKLIQRGRRISDDELMRSLDSRLVARAELTRTMEQHGVDLWLAPSAPGPAPGGLGSTGSPVMNLPWTHSGLPAITLPAGTDHEGLPLGAQLVGRWFHDEELLSQTEVIEQALLPLQGAKMV